MRVDRYVYFVTADDEYETKESFNLLTRPGCFTWRGWLPANAPDSDGWPRAGSDRQTRRPGSAKRDLGF